MSGDASAYKKLEKVGEGKIVCSIVAIPEKAARQTANDDWNTLSIMLACLRGGPQRRAISSI